MNISDAGTDLIKSFEQCRLSAYLDSVGVPTIGYGHTQGVSEGDICSQDDADAWLLSDLQDTEDCVNQALEQDVTQPQFDALCSLVFNIGCGAFKGSTLLKMVNAGNIQAAAQQFLRWDRAAGRELAGLLRRREAERDLFMEA